jgi:hypothetical protein
MVLKCGNYLPWSRLASVPLGHNLSFFDSKAWDIFRPQNHRPFILGPSVFIRPEDTGKLSR